MRLAKKYAVITGASSGIGVEFAKRFAAEGYSVVLVARREARLKKLKEELKVYMDTGTKCLIMKADLGDYGECKALVDKLKKLPVVIFINNAGFGDCGAFIETDLSKEMDMIDLNVKALHFLTKKMLRQFKRQGCGYLLNVASSAGIIPAGPYMATYYATKSYVVSLTRAIARELYEAGSNIYIGCLCPGPVDTEFNANANVEFSMKGISAEYCANYAVDMMKKRKVVIIPTFIMKTLMFSGRFIPQSLYVANISKRQKQKMW